jgi:hypothetical protein
MFLIPPLQLAVTSQNPRTSNRRFFFLANSIMSKRIFLFLFCFAIVAVMNGCDAATYPEHKVESSIQEICRDEYGIEGVEVKTAGSTIGVFLPLDKLFTSDVRHLVLSGKLENLESLFEPEPDAMEQLEDVLFTISRVMLSTDKDYQFYVLKAADIKSTGLQLVLTGFISDVRRVRLWDIPRSEYRKRVSHELKLNRTVIWEEPIRELFKDIENGVRGENLDSYFFFPLAPQTISDEFFNFLESLDRKEKVNLEILEIRSRSFTKVQGLVYVKFLEKFSQADNTAVAASPYASGSEFEYVFVVQPGESAFRVLQAVTLQEIDAVGGIRKIPFPPELRQFEDVSTWPIRFELEEVIQGDFLARQLNRRVQSLLTMDERVRLTIQHASMQFLFLDAKPGNDVDEGPRFQVKFNFLTKSMERPPTTIDEVLGDDDVGYVFRVIMKEFMDVMRGYSFSDYDGIDLVWEKMDSSEILRVPRAALEKFQGKKFTMADLVR